MHNQRIRYIKYLLLKFWRNINLRNFQYAYEALFRSEQYALVDNACREYLFLTEFFIANGPHAQDLFNQIMGKTLALLLVSDSLIDSHSILHF